MTPSASTAYLALSSARSFLNDINAVTWSDAMLFPMLQEAHRELSAKLISNGVGLIRAQSQIILVPALSVSPPQTGPIVLPNTPSDLVVPITMLEADVGDDIEDFIEMQQTDFVPDVDPVSSLIYWSWIGQQIKLVGSTQDNLVQLRYKAKLQTPQTLNDSLGVIFAELYLGPRIASLASPSRLDFKATADTNLWTVLQYNVTGDQGVPKRRQGYRRGALRRIY